MDFVARLTDQVSGPAQAGAGGVRVLRTELQAASAELASFSAAGGRLGGVTGGLSQAAGGAQAAAAATDSWKASIAGAGSEAAAAGATIKATWAAGQAEARAATGAFRVTGQVANSAGAAATGAGKAAADVGGKAAAAGKAGSSAFAAIGSGASGAAGAIGQLRGAVPLLLGALGIAGAGAAVKLALGYRGVAQLQAISARAEVNVRRLFSGVDPSPVIRAYARFTQLVSGSSVTGKALGEVITRSFNAAFAAIERLEPYVEAFAQGMLLAFLYAENGVLRARLALAPYETALGGVVSKSTLLKVAAVGGGLAVAAAATYAATAAAPFLALAAAVGAVAAAFEQASKLQKEWDENSSSQIWRKIKSDLGFGRSDADIGIVQGEAYDAQQRRGPVNKTQIAPALDAARVTTDQAAAAGERVNAAAAKGADPSKAAAAGNASGAAMAAGMVAGMKSGQAAVQKAGSDLAGAADQGVRDKAEIHSPSRLFRREAGYMGEGAVKGFEDKTNAVQRAATDALVPTSPEGRGERSSGPAPIVVQSLHIDAPHVFDVGGLEAFTRASLRRDAVEALESIGVPT